MNMSENERLAYDRYQYELSYQASIVESNYGLGRLEGWEEGREKGLEEGREKGLEEGREKGLEEGNEKGLEKGREEGEKRKALDVAFRMKQMGAALEDVIAITGLTREEVETVTS